MIRILMMTLSHNELKKMHENSIRNLNVNDFNLKTRGDNIVVLNNFENF